MKPELPKSLRWARAFALLQIILGIATVVLFIWLVDATPEHPFWIGFEEGIMERLEEVGIYEYDYEVAGALSALPIIGIFASLFVITAIGTRKKGWTYAALTFLIFQVFIGVTEGGIPLLSVIILILLLNKQNKVFLGLGKKPKDPNA